MLMRGSLLPTTTILHAMNCRLGAFSRKAKVFKIPSLRFFSQSTRICNAAAKKASPKTEKFGEPLRYGAYTIPDCTVFSNTYATTVYPERLLIWNAGTAKTAFVGWQKVTSVLVFGVACLFYAPRYVAIEGEANWKVIPGNSYKHDGAYALNLTSSK
jgi:hypothetical protein